MGRQGAPELVPLDVAAGDLADASVEEEDARGDRAHVVDLDQQAVVVPLVVEPPLDPGHHARDPDEDEAHEQDVVEDREVRDLGEALPDRVLEGDEREKEGQRQVHTEVDGAEAFVGNGEEESAPGEDGQEDDDEENVGEVVLQGAMVWGRVTQATRA